MITLTPTDYRNIAVLIRAKGDRSDDDIKIEVDCLTGSAQLAIEYPMAGNTLSISVRQTVDYKKTDAHPWDWHCCAEDHYGGTEIIGERFEVEDAWTDSNDEVYVDHELLNGFL